MNWWDAWEKARVRDGNETTEVSYQERRPLSVADEVCTGTGK